MGKNGKKQRHQQKPTARDRNYYLASDDDVSNFVNHPTHDDDDDDDDDDELQLLDDDNDEQQQEVEETHSLIPSKFSLYQQSVQSPKGDISYLQKFFLMYVGGRTPLHLQEDFCGTALLSTEWLRTDSRRTAVGLDLDLEAIMWCMQNNIENIGSDNSSRISLFHGNVLQPHEAKLVKLSPEDLIQNITIDEANDVTQDTPAKVPSMSERDIVCAFNYSCCCLHNRKVLVSYFKHARDCLSKKGGIFVMDVYGGTSSERELKLHRKFPNFTYTWEQAEFDVIQRKTRISLHYQLHKPQKKIRNAFSFNWRLWSLPELRDCLEEAGFRAVHFWIREMPDTETNRSTRGFGNSRDDKYEEVLSFQQLDAWNAYIVAVA